MTTVAYFAHLDYTEGTALRDHTGAVHFLTTATGLWQTLGDADASRLQLLGKLGVADVQALADDVTGLARIATSRQNVEV